MIDLLSSMQGLLHESGFVTVLASIDESPVVRFEDDTLMGFGCIFGDAGALISQWQAREMSLLTRHAPRLRSAGEKAWNVYCIFLSGSVASPSQNRQVHWIEENLERTRKIAACGVANRADLIRVLLPLLPLQYQPVLRPEDVTERLQRRLRTIAPKAADLVLDDSVSALEVVRLLGDSK